MIEVIRFHDYDGIGMFRSEHFEPNDFHDLIGGEDAYNAKKYPRLTRLIKRTNLFVKAPCDVFKNYKFMFKTQFLCDMFEPDEFGYLYDECNTNGLSIRYGRVKPDTPIFEDDHQVVVPPKSIYRMKTADRDFNGFIQHIDVCTKKMKAEQVDFTSRLVDIGRP